MIDFLKRHPWIEHLSLFLALIVAIIGFMRSPPPPPGRPVARTPTSTVPPRQIVPDSGFHWLMDEDGRMYRLELPYAAMSEAQKSAANKFARRYPEGLG